MSTLRKPASRGLREQSTRPALPQQKTERTVPTTRSRSTALHLINEAMARARMREPQIVDSEAHRLEDRSARRIAMRSLREQERRLGGR
jgi:hypothetical protein